MGGGDEVNGLSFPEQTQLFAHFLVGGALTVVGHVPHQQHRRNVAARQHGKGGIDHRPGFRQRLLVAAGAQLVGPALGAQGLGIMVQIRNDRQLYRRHGASLRFSVILIYKIIIKKKRTKVNRSERNKQDGRKLLN